MYGREKVLSNDFSFIHKTILPVTGKEYPYVAK